MRAGVYMSEIDLSQGLRPSAGFYGMIQIKAPKGLLGLQLVSGETDLLRKYTPDETIKIGYDQAFWSALAFLQKSNKLWVSRLIKNASYSSAIVKSVEYESFDELTILEGITINPVNNTFSSTDATMAAQLQTGSPIKFSTATILPPALDNSTIFYAVKVGNNLFQVATTADIAYDVEGVRLDLSLASTSSVVTATFATDLFTIPDTSLNTVLVTGYKVYFTTTTTLPAPLQANVNYYLVRISNATFKVALTYANAIASVPIVVDLADAGTGTHTAVIRADVSEHSVETPVNSQISLSAAFTANATTDEITLDDADPLLNRIGNIAEITFTTTNTLPAPLEPNTKYYLIDEAPITTVPNESYVFKLAESRDDAINGVNINLTSAGTGVHSLNVRLNDPEEYAFAQYECLEFYPVSPGLHGDALYVKLTDNSNITPDSFKIEVFVAPDLVNPVESPIIASRKLNSKDGFNRGMYIENVIKASQYIRCNDNQLIDEDINPMFQASPLRLKGGHDGDDVLIGDMMQDLSTNFINPDKNPGTVIMDGGNAFSTNAAYAREILRIAALRDQSVGVLSCPLDLELDSQYLSKLIDYKQTVLNANSSFGAIYSPHARIYDKYNYRENLIVSPDGYVAGLISETGTNFQLWYPVAGKRRGIFNSVDGLIRDYNDTELDELYRNGINPIVSMEGDGIYLMGQKTLLNLPSALDRLNVRLLLTVIKPTIKRALMSYLFEFNDENTRQDINNLLNSYLSDVKTKRGLYDYLIVCDGSNNSLTDIDNYILNVWIFIKPTKAAEIIPTKVVLTRTDMSFGLAANLIR